SAPGAVRGAPKASGPGAGTGTDRLRCGCSSGPRGVSRILPSADRRGPAVTEPAAVPAGASSAARGNQWAGAVTPGPGGGTRLGGTGQIAPQSSAWPRHAAAAGSAGPAPVGPSAAQPVTTRRYTVVEPVSRRAAISPARAEAATAWRCGSS